MDNRGRTKADQYRVVMPDAGGGGFNRMFCSRNAGPRNQVVMHPRDGERRMHGGACLRNKAIA